MHPWSSDKSTFGSRHQIRRTNERANEAEKEIKETMSEITRPTDAALRRLDAALKKIKSDHGDESVIDFASGPRRIAATPSGILPLDIALGIGGVPEGRIVEIYGPESSGKTTLCYHLIAEAQKQGGICAFIDMEHAMDANYAAAIGVRFTDEDGNPLLVTSQPDYGEEALDIAVTMVQSGAFSLVVIDSVAALTPKAEIEGTMGDQNVGLQARMMSKACRKLAPQANQNGTTIVFTNQIREKVGVFFGSPETQPGGRALKFYASQRLDIRRIGSIKDGDEVVGNEVKVKVQKNKVAAPFMQCQFIIAFGEGYDRLQTLINMSLERRDGQVTKSGAFYTFHETGDKAQGAAKAKAYLKEHPEVADKIEATIRAAVFGSDATVDETLAEPVAA
jgi:recombination protein RecA